MSRASTSFQPPSPADGQRRRVLPFTTRLLATAAAGLSLAACQDEQSAFAPACPHVDIIGEAADYYSYDGKGLDLGDLVSHATITGMTGACAAGPMASHHRKTVRTNVTIAMTVERGPAAKGETLTLPYFIAVVRDGKILNKKIFNVDVTFAPNTTVTSVRSPVRVIDLPASNSIEDTDYHMAVGFQLNHAQLEYNRIHVTNAQFHKHTN